MSDSWERLYREQCEKHEATHKRLREAEKRICNLRCELSVTTRELNNAISMLQGMAVNINKAYPKEQENHDNIK